MKIKVLKIRIADEFLHDDQKTLNHFLENHEIIKTETAYVADEKFWSVVLYFVEIEKENADIHQKNTAPENYSARYEDLNQDEIKIFDALKLWRAEKAKEQNLPTYFIANNKELVSVAKYKPQKKEGLQNIKGFGKHKIENYGEEILEILESV